MLGERTVKTPQLGLGLYDLREGARLTRLDPKRVRRWFAPPPSESDRKPILTPDYPRVQDEVAISFLDLIDVFVFGNLRKHGVPLQTLRKVYSRLQRDFKQILVVTHIQELKDMFPVQIEIVKTPEGSRWSIA